MLPFPVRLVPGESPYRQVVYAATKAIVSGDLAAGATFPSVRELSHALKINPNTAQKVVADLQRAGLIEVCPGIGTVVSSLRRATAAERRALLTRELEQLLVEAKRLGLCKDELVDAIENRWRELFDEPRLDEPRPAER